jgi:hypothetical protein
MPLHTQRMREIIFDGYFDRSSAPLALFGGDGRGCRGGGTE